ncbi:MAG TPA: DMT family transporter [Bacillota bacterium]|nr:DMT family transporter [Bacillota bacterium]HNT04345.1 DMT family transporter [Bacillota bacterium]HPA55713.1 DMT family transporter [Bacillota bacterium]HPX68228.1 DMT family transporter [Bacillota bacterium]HQA65918.1 DMT family transporter [Bacillota bacterium]
MNRNKVGYVYVLLAAFFFALIAVIGKTVINSGIKIFDLLVLQYTASFVFMLIYFVIAGIRKLSLPKESLKAVLTQGLIGSSCTTVLFYLALEKLNAGIASMLLFTHPVLVSIYFMATKTRKITRRSNLALLTAFFGSIMVINVFNIGIAGTPFIGFVFGIMSSCTYAFYNIYADVKLKDFEPLVIAFYTNLTTLAVSLILHPGFFRFEFLMTSELLIYIFELAVVSGILPVIFLYKGIKLIGADKASIVATSELPITILLSFFVLGERMGLVQLAGILLIMGSIIILQYEGKLEGG